MQARDGIALMDALKFVEWAPRIAGFTMPISLSPGVLAAASGACTVFDVTHFQRLRSHDFG